MPGDKSDLPPLRQDAAGLRDANMSGRDAYQANRDIHIHQSVAPPTPLAPTHGRGNGRSASGTGTGGNGKDSTGAGMRALALRFLGTPPGIAAIVLALIVVFSCGLLAGTQLSGHPQHTVYVTVTPNPRPTSGATSPAAQPSSQAATYSSAPPSASTSAPATAPGTALSSLTPVDSSASSFVDNFTPNSPQQIGTTTYPDAIRFSCSSASDGYTDSELVYNVAGFTMLTATIGIPPNAADAAGNSATIQFFEDGGSTQLGQTLTVALNETQQVSLNLHGSAQLEIYCQAANGNNDGNDIDVVIGTATLSKS